MVSATKWALLDHQTAWATTNLNITVITDRACDLWLCWTTINPWTHLHQEAKRGVLFLADPTYCFVCMTPVHQLDVGDVTLHHFTIPGWYHCRRLWWYFYGNIAGVPSLSRSPIFTAHYTAPLGPLPPQPIPASILIPFEHILCRPSNRFTFWAQGHWYAVLGDLSSIRVYKLTAGVFARMDAANEPSPGVGTFRSLDARVSSDQTRLHIALYCNFAEPPPNEAQYYTFNTTADLWSTKEVVATPTLGTKIYRDVAISLDAADIPHVVFTHLPGAWLEIWYSNRIGGVWSAPFQALTLAADDFKNPSVYHSPGDNSFHLLAHDSHSYDHYRRRLASGAWDARYREPARSWGTYDISLATDDLIPHNTRMNAINRASHAYGQPPANVEDNLTPATRTSFSMITQPTATPDQLIVYRGIGNRPYYIKKPWGGAWAAENQLDIQAGLNLSANLADSIVVSYVHRISFPLGTSFWAFNFP